MKRLATEKATEILKVGPLFSLVLFLLAGAEPTTAQTREPRLPSATFIKAYLEAFRPRAVLPSY